MPQFMPKMGRVSVGSAALVATLAVVWGGILFAQKHPGDPPAALSDHQLREIEAIRQRLGSVVPTDSLLGATPPVKPASPAPTLTPEDPLSTDLAAWSTQLETRARKEAAQGNWELGIPLHQIAQQMQQLVPASSNSHPTP